jgi:hypothetical protein
MSDINEKTELRLDCNACHTQESMAATKVPKFSSIVRTIGAVLLIPSFLGMLVCFGMIIIPAAANAGQGGHVMTMMGVILFIPSLVGGLLGWLLLLNRNVWKCQRCGSILDRA